MMALDLERCFTEDAPTVKEAVTKAWRAYVSASMGEDASTWEPDALRVTAQHDPELTCLTDLPDHTDEPLVVVDIDRMRCPMGFVAPVMQMSDL